MKNCLDTDITVFKNYWTTIGGRQHNLLKFLQNDKYYATQLLIAKLRDKEYPRYKKEKALMICFTPSCKDCTERSATADYVHTGLIQIDIDQKDNPNIKDWAALKKEISTIPNIAYCGLSISGYGLWCLIPISDPTKHLEYYYFLEEVFKRNKLTIDPSCKNVQRLRGYAYDPKAYFNYNATPLSLHLKRGNNPSRVLAINKNNSQIEATINYIIQNNIDLAPDYNEYLNLAFCFSYEYGPGGVDYFLKVCSTHSKYNEREAIQKFNSALRDNKGLVRMGSFFHLCGLKGIDYKNLGSSSIKSSDHTRKINPLKQGLLQKGNVFQNTTNHVKELSTITVNNIEQTEKYELFYYEKDLINMLNNANLKIRDPKYLKWIEKEINKLIEMRSPKRKSDPDIKQLIDSINSI